VASKNNSTQANQLNVIGGGTTIEGTIISESSVIVEGKIIGKLICKKTVTVYEAGSIDGDVEAESAIISGKVKGKLIAADKVVLKEKSSMIGELQAKKLTIYEGAVFDGTSDMGLTQSSNIKSQPIKTIKTDN